MTAQTKAKRDIMPKPDRDRQWLWAKGLQTGDRVKNTKTGDVFTVKMGEVSNPLVLPPVVLIDAEGKSRKIMRQQLVVAWEAA